MLRVCVGPTSQKTVTHELMASCAKLAREHEGVRLHTHLAENAEDVEYTLKMHGYRFGDYIRCARVEVAGHILCLWTACHDRFSWPFCWAGFV